MESGGKKGVGILLLFVGVLIGLFANRYPFGSSTFWVSIVIGLLVWYIGSFKFLLTDGKKAKDVVGYLWCIIILLGSALLIIWSEAMKNLAKLNNNPATNFVALQIIGVIIFVIGGLYVAKTIINGTKVKKGKKRK